MVSKHDEQTPMHGRNSRAETGTAQDNRPASPTTRIWDGAPGWSGPWESVDAATPEYE